MLSFLNDEEVTITSKTLVVDGKVLLPVTKQFYIKNDDPTKIYQDIVLRFEFAAGATGYFDTGAYNIQVIESISEPSENEWYATGRNNRLGLSDIGPAGSPTEMVSIWVRVVIPPNQDIMTISDIQLICNYEESLAP